MNCLTCKFVVNKETKGGRPYGFCNKTKLLMLAVQVKCKYYKGKDK